MRLREEFLCVGAMVECVRNDDAVELLCHLRLADVGADDPDFGIQGARFLCEGFRDFDSRLATRSQKGKQPSGAASNLENARRGRNQEIEIINLAL